MHRLFVAIRPPQDIRAQLLALMGGIAGARWQDDAQLHLTLRFIGEVERPMANDLADILKTVRFTDFTIALAGTGCFDRKGHIDTLWAGVQPRDPLAALHHKIDRACTRIGLAPDVRSYLPHITLARFNRSSGSVAEFTARHAALASRPFAVDGFSLFESRLGHGGATYHPVEDYPAVGAQGL